MTVALSHQVISSSVSCPWTKEPGKRNSEGNPSFPLCFLNRCLHVGKSCISFCIHINNNYWMCHLEVWGCFILNLRNALTGFPPRMVIRLDEYTSQVSSQDSTWAEFMFVISQELKTLLSFGRCAAGSCFAQFLRSGPSSFPGYHMQDVEVSTL